MDAKESALECMSANGPPLLPAQLDLFELGFVLRLSRRNILSQCTEITLRNFATTLFFPTMPKSAPDEIATPSYWRFQLAISTSSF